MRGGGRPRPDRVFLEVLRRYLRDRGEMVVAMAEASGQERVRVSLRGLWRRYEPGSTGYQWFMDAVEELVECRECMEELRRRGIVEVVLEPPEGEDPYIVIELRGLKEMLREARGSRATPGPQA